MISYKVTTDSIVPLITLADAKIWLKIDDYTVEDSLINSLVESARMNAESYCNRAFLNQTIVQKFDDFTDLVLMRPPVQSVTSIYYENTEGDSTLLATTYYELDDYAYPNRIVAKYNKTFPGVSGRKNAVTVTYVAGYGDTPAEVPEGIVDAVKVLLSDYYRNRDNPTRRFPTLVEKMLAPYVVERFC